MHIAEKISIILFLVVLLVYVYFNYSKQITSDEIISQIYTNLTTNEGLNSTFSHETTTTMIRGSAKIVSLDLKKEIVEINGYGDIRNWSLVDSSGNEYIFNMFLNGTVFVKTGFGIDNNTYLFWKHAAVWDNRGDKACIYNNKKQIIDCFCCSSGFCNKSNDSYSKETKSLPVIQTTTTTNKITTTTTTSNPIITTTTTLVELPHISELSLNDEYVIIEGNYDIMNWSLHDDGSNFVYVFSCPLKDNLTLKRGYGNDTVHMVYWNSNSYVWNNDGDTAYLIDNDNNTVDMLHCEKDTCYSD